jgi:hypothetical protein
MSNGLDNNRAANECQRPFVNWEKDPCEGGAGIAGEKEAGRTEARVIIIFFF